MEITSPDWEHVSDAIRKMDDNEYPVLEMSWAEVETCGDDEESFHIVGGSKVGFALSNFCGDWRFEDPDGGEEEVRLWQSDQGYFCKRKNIIADIDVVLKLARIYFETGSYDEIRNACVKL
ncbi:hypothetical protein [Dyella sp. 2HG41-7]|uniref:hypothetical protein n=1 Tax=Dyella sp. 2HG41-7 TaxID=2883239 RepID=UPI001F1BB2B2|nr:hypothetical protein [Dyella sp. 2HG41-7]